MLSGPRTHGTRLSQVPRLESYLNLLACSGTCGKREVTRRLSHSYFRKTKTDPMSALYGVSIMPRWLIYSHRLPEEPSRGHRTDGGLLVNTVYHYHHCISPNVPEPQQSATPQPSRDLHLERTLSNPKCLIVRERSDFLLSTSITLIWPTC